MARHLLAPLSAGLLGLLTGCERFYALGPGGCDEVHACSTWERPRCELATGRCLPAAPASDLAAADTTDALPADGPACAGHGDCPSGVCDELGLTTAEPGRCVPEHAVATVQTAAALREALPRARGIRLAAGTYQGDWVIALQSVVLVGPAALSPVGAPAVLQPAGGGAVLRVGARGRVMVDGVAVRGGVGDSGHGVVCDGADGRLAVRRAYITDNGGRGIWARCPLQVTQTRIGGWDGIGNRGGGVVAEDALSLTNSYLCNNGTAFSDVGGLAIRGPLPLVRSVSHLTFIGNQAVSSGVAVHCGGTALILWRSLFFEQRTVDKPLLAGDCQLPAAAIDDAAFQRPDSVKLGPANPPLFRGLSDFHLQPRSPAKDAVPESDGGPRLPVDFDGDRRPQGAGYDFGADEVL